MACTLTKGRAIDCRDNVGGLNEVLVTEFENIDQAGTTVTAGVVTAMTQVSGTSFWRYSLEKENGDFVVTEENNQETGTLHYVDVLNFTLKKMSAADSEELKLLALNRLVIITKDNNGTYRVHGLEFGADKTGGTNQAVSGKAFGDMNGYTLGFTSKETNYPFEVDSATISSLTIG